MLPHPPYCPHALWSNLQLFGTSEELIEAHKFQHDKQVQQVSASLSVSALKNCVTRFTESENAWNWKG
jgi:hypothetical protein